MRRLLLAVVIVALFVAVVAPALSKMYPQELGWMRSFTADSLGANLAGKFSSLGKVFSAGQQRNPAVPGEAAPEASSGTSPAGGAAAASGSQRRELTDWEKVRSSAGKHQLGSSPAGDKTTGVVLIRSVPSNPDSPPAPEPVRRPKLSAHTTIIAGDLNEASVDSVADAARRSRKRAQLQPGQAPAR
jgi:hypothetical protein